MTGMSELFLFAGLGYVLLGPKRMHVVLQQIARAKREFDNARRQIDKQLSRAMEADTKGPGTDVS
jgi:Sec-independent protein translocase protein TatA